MMAWAQPQLKTGILQLRTETPTFTVPKCLFLMAPWSLRCTQVRQLPRYLFTLLLPTLHEHYLRSLWPERLRRKS